MKRVFRVVGHVFVISVFVVAILVGMTQTAIFKEWVRQFVEREAAKYLNGEVRVGKISGTFITKLHLEDVEWWYEGEQAINIRSLSIAINPVRFLHREIHLRNAVLMYPDVQLLRDEYGILNVSQLVKRRESADTPDGTESGDPETDTSTSFPRWIYRLDNVEILGGQFQYRDYSRASNKPGRDYRVSFPTINYDDVSVYSIYLTMSALSDGRNHTIDLRSMNFSLSDPDFSVSQISLQAAFSPSRSQLNRLRVVTDRTTINLSGGISDYNVLGRNEGKISEKELELSLFADRLHFDDLKMFIPAVWFLEGDVGIDLAVEGSLDGIQIEKLDVQFGRSLLSLAGSVSNVTQGQEMTINAEISDSRIDPGDINSLLPYFSIPDYSHLGVLDIAVDYAGKPRKFDARIDLHSSAGIYSGRIAMDLTRRPLRYDGSLIMRNGDIAAILQNDLFPNALDGRIRFQGRGTRLDDLIADAQVDIQHMQIRTVSMDSLMANFRARHHDLSVTLSGLLEESEFVVNATSELIDLDTAPFDVRVDFRSLDLARVLNDSAYVSDLTFSLVAQGTGLRPRSMFGELTVELEPSSFRDYNFVGEPVSVSIDRIDTTFRELRLQSELVDVYLAGEFDLPTIAGISYAHMRQLVRSVREDIESIASGGGISGRDYISTLKIQDPLDTIYDIEVKNLEALSIFLGHGEFELEAKGKLYGYFRTIDTVIHLGGDIEIDHFMYVSETERILFDRINGWYNIDNDYTRGGVEGIAAVFDIRAEGIYNRSMSISNAHIRSTMRGSHWHVHSSAVIDTAFSYEIDAIIQFDTALVHAELHTLTLRYGDLLFSNSESLALRYDKAGVWFDGFTLFHNEPSRIEITGLYSFTDTHDIQFALRRFELEEVHRLLSPDAVRRRLPLFSGWIDITGSIGGRTDNLISKIDVQVREVEYGGVSFGDIRGTLGYEERQLQFNFRVADTRDAMQTAFQVDGFLPFDVLSATGERVPDGPLHVHIFSDGFDLSVVDPFVSDLRNFRGKMTSDVTVSGTVENPLYEGQLEITEGQFTFVPNNVVYHFAGKLEPRQNELIISQLYIENRRRDLADGRVNFQGTVQTRGLQIRDFNLVANGQLKVLRMAARRPGDMLYGDLVVATGSDGISLTGSMDESRLTGTVLIRSASLIFPPARGAVYDRTGSIVNYIVIEDTESEIEDLTPLEKFFRDLAQEQERRAGTERPRRSFLDGLDYDVTIQTDGRVELTMIFNQITGEELTARIETTSLRMYRDDLTGLRLVGNVDIREPSAYSFYRRFDARGRISFVGPPDNPEFDITATYSGQRIPIQQAARNEGEFGAGSPGVPELVEVRLHITGDRYEPKLDIRLFVDNQEREGDVETDAISYILTGRFQTELESGDYRTISADFGRGIPATFMSGVATSLLSNVFSDFLRNEVRFIRTAEIVWHGGNIMDTAELRISGELRNFYWTIGGRVFNDIGNTNFSFQIPMGPVFNSDRWTNLFLELERRSQSIEFSEIQRPVNAARLYYSISF